DRQRGGTGALVSVGGRAGARRRSAWARGRPATGAGDRKDQGTGYGQAGGQDRARRETLHTRGLHVRTRVPTCTGVSVPGVLSGGAAESVPPGRPVRRGPD